MADNTAFALGLITSALQWIMVMLSWVLTTYLGRRTIYVWGSFINCAFLVALGIAGSVGTSIASSNAQASLGLIVAVLFCLGPAPASWVIIGETSSIRLRPLTTGVGRGAYYAGEHPLHLPGQLYAQSRPGQPRRSLWLRLGRHRLFLLVSGLVLASRDEAPILSRD